MFLTGRANLGLAFGGLPSPPLRQSGHATLAFLSAIWWRKAENILPQWLHKSSIESWLAFALVIVRLVSASDLVEPFP